MAVQAVPGGIPTASDDRFRVVLYARVSTDDKGQTVETQLRELREYCSRNDWRIMDVYTDEKTATNARRPGFREMKGRLSEGDVDYVVARNQDRISREPKDYQDFLDFCSKFRVRVRFSDNDAKPETPDGVLFDAVQMGLAKADNMKRSANTQKGMMTRKLQGIHMGRKLAFCFVEDLDEVFDPSTPSIRYRDVVQTEGEYRTVVVSKDTILGFARQGYSLSKAAKTLGVSHMTLRRAVASHGMAEEYYGMLGRPVPQGLVNTTVGDRAEIDNTKVGDEN